MRLLSLLLLSLLCIAAGMAQSDLRVRVVDDGTNEPIIGTQCLIRGTVIGSMTDADGVALIHSVPSGAQTIVCSFIGYRTAEFAVTLPMPRKDTVIVIALSPSDVEMDAITVTALRTNSRIEDLPTRVEVLGLEEMADENSIQPATIASILGDVSGVQIQQTSSVTANTEARIQGLPGRYTQILRDGFPLAGDFSGSFSLLQIPPVDLQQIELIKGASSTLYGGGAIAGLINLVSKHPPAEGFEQSVTLNRTSLSETDVNGFFAGRFETFGYTFFAGATRRVWKDIDHDRFTDVPDQSSLTLHPRIFFTLSDRSSLIVGDALTVDRSKGGDVANLNGAPDPLRPFYTENRVLRNSIDLVYQHTMEEGSDLRVKVALNGYRRSIATDVFGMTARQQVLFTEASYSFAAGDHAMVTGINMSGESFTKLSGDTLRFGDARSSVTGVFAQDDWTLSRTITLETGLRVDHTSSFGSFILPRLFLLLRPAAGVTVRLGAGLGYKTPDRFAAEIDERSIGALLPLPPGLKAETSAGTNLDVNTNTRFGSWAVTFNQSLFLTRIRDPLLVVSDSSGLLSHRNAGSSMRTAGSETYLRLEHAPFDLYFGYNFTDARRAFDPLHPYLPLIARHKFAMVAGYDVSPSFQPAIEWAYTGSQFLENGQRTPGYAFLAGSLKFRFPPVILVLNGENLLDERQTKRGPVVLPPASNPVFAELYAPIEGRVINLSMNITW